MTDLVILFAAFLLIVVGCLAWDANSVRDEQDLEDTWD